MKRLEQVRSSMLRLGINAENAFLSATPFAITLEFPSLGAALAFRLDFYQTRKFLNHLRDRNKPEVTPMLSALSGLNRLSCARCDREPALRHLSDFGYVPLNFSMKDVADMDIESQFDALGLSDIDKSINTVTLTNKEFLAAHGVPDGAAFASSSTSPQALYKPTAAPSAPIELPIADPNALSTSFFIFDYNCTPQDFMARSAHETALKLQAAIDAFINEPCTVTQANLRRLRRKLLDGQISDELRDLIMNHPSIDEMLAQSFA